MGAETLISWSDATWNPAQGCAKVSPGCKNCYMFRDMARYGRIATNVHESARATFRAPLRRHRDGTWAWPDGMDVFTASWSDWFLPEWDAWRPRAWEIIRARPGLRFYILSKRPENMTPERFPPGWPFPNVVLGVSVESAAYMERIRVLRAVADRLGAAGLLVSIEPLLSSLENFLEPLALVDWIIAGGESGPRARPCHPIWLRQIRDRAVAEGKEFHFKQWGRYTPADKTWLVPDYPGIRWRRPTIVLSYDGTARDPADVDIKDWKMGDQRMVDAGPNWHGRTLDGRTWDARAPVGRAA